MRRAQVYYLLAGYSWASYLNSLKPYFFVCEMGTMMSALSILVDHRVLTKLTDVKMLCKLQRAV